ncbi:MAG: VWA domain-containing protein [Candidatus Solibacter sp.]
MHIVRPTRWAALVTILSAALPAWSQTVPTLRSETRAVQINVVATDGRGHPIGDLKRENFSVMDNGKPRDIQIFALEGPDHAEPARLPTKSDQPTAAEAQTSALLMDAINDYWDDHVRAWTMATRRIEKLQSGERMALYVLEGGIRILQPYTSDRALLLKALRAYKPPPIKPRPALGRGTAGIRGGVPVGDDVSNRTPPAIRQFEVRRRAADSLDAFRIIANHLAMLPGRKSLIWLTSGFPPETLRDVDPEYRRAIAALNEANVALYTVDARGLLVNRGDGPNIDTMRDLAEATGGKAYYHRNDIDHALEEAAEDVRRTYTLGFYIPEQERDGRVHELRVRVDRAHVELRYRKSYYAGTEQSPARPAKITALDDELLNPLDVHGMRMVLRVERMEGEHSALRLHITLDPQGVTLMPDSEGWSGKLDHLFVESDANGKILARIADPGGFHITPNTRPQFDRIGAAYAVVVPLKENTATLQVFVRDIPSGRTGSKTVSMATSK